MLPCMVPILPNVVLGCFWIQCAAVVEWAFYRKDGTHNHEIVECFVGDVTGVSHGQIVKLVSIS